MNKEEQLPCPHGNSSWSSCSHCLGLVLLEIPEEWGRFEIEECIQVDSNNLIVNGFFYPKFNMNFVYMNIDLKDLY